MERNGFGKDTRVTGERRRGKDGEKWVWKRYKGDGGKKRERWREMGLEKIQG